MPRSFRQTKLTSFKRQLKLYGFELISFGEHKGGYRHNLFSKKDPEKCRAMKRVAIKSQSKSGEAVKKSIEDEKAEADGSESTTTSKSSSSVGAQEEDTSSAS